MTVLFSVGQGSDKPSLVSELLNIEKNPSKPGYKLADPEPLVLTHCEYSPNPFKGNENQQYLSSPASIFANSLEKAMVGVLVSRVGLDDLLPKPEEHFQYMAGKHKPRSIMEVQRGGTFEEKVGKLKGNKKKRHLNVQTWKANTIEKEKTEGAPSNRNFYRNRSRSQERQAKEDAASSKSDNEAAKGSNTSKDNQGD